MRTLLVELSTACSGVASLAELYRQYAPTIEALFR
jgi:hypothetical protein